MALTALRTEDATYIPASGHRSYFRMTEVDYSQWCWQLLIGPHGGPIGCVIGPFGSRGEALDDVERWIDTHQDEESHLHQL
jgi:hypothetical protein